MRKLLGFILVIVGVAIAAAPHVQQLRDHLPADWQNGLVPWQAWAIGGSAVLIGALLVCCRASTSRGLSDGPIRAIFEQRRFRFTPFPDGGWQAEGTWDDTPISARWECGYHAGRFGRPWVLVVTCPGTPADPLPLAPTQAVVAERHADRFTVVLPEAGLAGGHRSIIERIGQVLTSRQ